MKLLIVENNPQMRRMLKSVVADLVETVTECGDGAEAVAAYAAEQLSAADWVLMDLEMPQVGGLEATRRLVAVDPWARVIIVTQYTFLLQPARTGCRSHDPGACPYD